MKNKALPFFLSLALVAGAAPALAAKVKGSFKKTLKIPANKEAGLTLEILNGNGAIRVKGGKSGQVLISGKIRAKRGWLDKSAARRRVRELESNPPIEWVNKIITVGRISDSDLRKDVTIDYQITVPLKTKVKARSGNGGVVISGVEGAIEAHTGNGTIRIAEPKGTLQASTGNGSVRVTGAPLNRWDISSGNGQIRLYIPFKTSFSLDVETGNGSIETGHPLSIRGRHSPHRLRGVVRGGGPLVKVRTGNGSVEIAASGAAQ